MSEQFNLEQEIQQAHNAYKARDYQNAAFHIAGALAQDPLNQEALSLFDTVLDEAPERSQLIALGDNNFYGEVIASAYIEAKNGEYQKAINLLIQVFTQFPELELEHWLDQWLAAARFRAISIDIEPIAKFLKGLINDTNERMRMRPTEVLFYRRFCKLVSTVEKYYIDQPELLDLGAKILRRAERFDDAQHLATSQFQRSPDTQAALTQGNIYRAAGQYNRAISCFDQAWKLEQDPYLYIEMAKVKWDAGGQKAAGKFLKKAHKKSEGRVEGNQDYNLMHRYLNADPDLTKILGADTDIRSDDFIALTTPLLGYLLPVRDASLVSLRNVSADDLQGQNIQIAVTCIEPPSVRLAIAMATTGDHQLNALEYLFDNIPAKDPRCSHNDPQIIAWAYNESVPYQAVAQPGHDAIALVLSLANQAYYLPRWWAQAKQLMTGHSMNLGELIGVMVYPPDLPSDMNNELDIGQWLRQVQIASALLIGAAENQWKNSLRREILLNLLEGPIDWVTEAALIALCEIGLDCPESVPEISYTMETLSDRIPESGYWSITATLPLCYRRLPGRPYYMRDSMAQMLNRYQQAVEVQEPEIIPEPDEILAPDLEIAEECSTKANTETEIKAPLPLPK